MRRGLTAPFFNNNLNDRKMTATIVGFLTVLLINIVMAIFVASIAKERGINFWRAFFVSLFMGPVIGFMYIIVKCMK